MARIQGKCIFCGGTGLTKEHVFPKWARSLLRIGLEGHGNHANSRITTARVPFTNIVTISPSREERQGHLFNKRLRVVCKVCNGGWMSKVESQSKDILTKLIRGDEMLLDEESQRMLSFWTCLRAAVFERDHPDTAAMTKEEYVHIHTTLTPPRNWRVCIAPLAAEDWRIRIDHYGAEAMVLGRSRQGRPNTQRTIIGMKKVALYAISSTANEAAGLVEKMSPRLMTQIHPYFRDFDWPFPNSLSTEDMRKVGHMAPPYIHT